MDITKHSFGTLPSGPEIFAYTLKNQHDLAVTILTYGGIIQSLKLGSADLVLGYDTLAPYLDNPAYFGAAIGRVANRIRNAEFEIDGRRYRLPKNETPHNLHSGPKGFEQALWDASVEGNTLILRRIDPDGTNGFPGTLNMSYRFSLDGTALKIDMIATTDAPTLCNPTHHSYFNLGSVLGQDRLNISSHALKLYASEYTPTKADGIPIGTLASVKDTPYDFQISTPIGHRTVDHNFSVTAPSKPKALRPVATLSLGPRSMILETTLPGLQIYTGDFIPKDLGKGGTPYAPRAGLAMEPQYFPDAPNCPAFQNIILRPNETYSETIRYVFKTL